MIQSHSKCLHLSGHSYKIAHRLYAFMLNSKVTTHFTEWINPLLCSFVHCKPMRKKIVQCLHCMKTLQKKICVTVFEILTQLKYLLTVCSNTKLPILYVLWNIMLHVCKLIKEFSVLVSILFLWTDIIAFFYTFDQLGIKFKSIQSRIPNSKQVAPISPDTWYNMNKLLSMSQ